MGYLSVRCCYLKNGSNPPVYTTSQLRALMAIVSKPIGQEDLTKIIFNRDGTLPTIVASQTSAAYWLEALPDRVGADSLVSRLNTGQRINLGDYDIRQHLAYTHTPND